MSDNHPKFQELDNVRVADRSKLINYRQSSLPGMSGYVLNIHPGLNSRYMYTVIIHWPDGSGRRYTFFEQELEKAP